MPLPIIGAVAIITIPPPFAFCMYQYAIYTTSGVRPRGAVPPAPSIVVVILVVAVVVVVQPGISGEQTCYSM